MNQILIGIITSFILFSCGRQENATKANSSNENSTETPTIVTKEVTNEVRLSNEQLALNRGDSVELDASIHNQYKDGEKDGLWKEMDKKGRMLSEGYYKNGKANGWMKWYYKGVLTAEGNMIENKRNGPWMICDVDDTSSCIEANFEDESREGVWKSYYDNGKLYKEQTWKDNQPIAEKCWDEMGNSMTCK
jgi:antitoxin component YwqK of YwqJK toxin-antitoxin module